MAQPTPLGVPEYMTKPHSTPLWVTSFAGCCLDEFLFAGTLNVKQEVTTTDIQTPD